MQPVTQRRDSAGMLRELPEVFDLRDVTISLDLSRTNASQYCWRWSRMGLVRPVGPKAGTFYNLLRDPTGPETRRPEAVQKRLRRPVALLGGSALHAHGWTTQRHQRTELAVPAAQGEKTLPQMSGFVLERRPVSWFVSMRRAIAESAERGGDTVAQGFPLPPAEWALVDALSAPEAARGVWRPAADDVELPPECDASEAVARILEACAALGADTAAVLGFASRVDGLEDAAEEALASASPSR